MDHLCSGWHVVQSMNNTNNTNTLRMQYDGWKKTKQMISPSARKITNYSGVCYLSTLLSVWFISRSLVNMFLCFASSYASTIWYDFRIIACRHEHFILPKPTLTYQYRRSKQKTLTLGPNNLWFIHSYVIFTMWFNLCALYSLETNYQKWSMLSNMQWRNSFMSLVRLIGDFCWANFGAHCRNILMVKVVISARMQGEIVRFVSSLHIHQKWEKIRH